MKVHYKGLIFDRVEDAPFLGVLWIAPGCSHHCPGCYNQYLLDKETYYVEASDIINKIKSDIFAEGIIFAGLDPLTYPDELIYMIGLALQEELKVIVYTFLPNRESLLSLVPDFSRYIGKGIYIKYGAYEQEHGVSNYQSNGVTLSTVNQYIELL